MAKKPKLLRFKVILPQVEGVMGRHFDEAAYEGTTEHGRLRTDGLRARAPVKTGALRDSIQPRVIKTATGYQGQIWFRVYGRILYFKGKNSWMGDAWTATLPAARMSWSEIFKKHWD